ncbi:MAG: hypothetical protein GY723_00930 [bacterium]|nr:hypothetical protein [bacterium]
MSDAHTVDNSIDKAAFWSAIVLLLAGVLSAIFPLDAPEGPFAERMIWFSSNVGAFVMGWVVQMIAMLSLSGVFAGVAWQIRKSHPVRAFVAGVALLISVVAFIIPKFIAIWSIPQMVVSSATVSADSFIAEQLLQLLNPSLSFSLFTSFDYLGFWMYGVFGLLVARPLFRLTWSAKIAAVGFGLYGLLYHILLTGVMTGSVITADIGGYAESIGALLLVPVISMAVHFRMNLKKVSNA